MQIQNNSAPNIVTFGSCLSRFTSQRYIRFFGGKLISSVYHNRSEAFCGRLLDHSWYVDPFDEIMASLVQEDQHQDKDSEASQMLKNQYLDTIGLHRLNTGCPLFDAVKSGNIDLFIVDNYMDLAARLISQPGKPTSGLFLKLNSIQNKNTPWEMGSYLSPADGVNNMYRVLDFFRKYNPHARIVFINFPHNTYASSPERVARTEEYAALFDYPHCDVIPSLTIPEINQTEVKMHFEPMQYAAYAGVIGGMALTHRF